jgi:glycerol-3-phosphate dehydrogenase
VRTAALDHGAVAVNHTEVVELTHDDAGRVTGAVVEADGQRISVAARAVVNAAGVWSDEVRALDEGAHPDSIRPAKGIHITVPWAKVRNDIAVVVPVPKDKRSVFVVPWLPNPDGTFQLTYIGTTDTDYDGPLDNPQCTPEDVDYLLRAINWAVQEPLSTADVVGTWAGLRPLVKAAATGRTADLSRRHKVRVGNSGVVSVTGGKLTTYREMAEDAVDAVVDHLGDLPRSARRGRTAKLVLRGGGAVPGGAGEHLAGRYGSESSVISAMVDADPALAEPLVDGLPYLRAEALYAVRHEMALTVDDVLARRTRARLQARDASAAAAASVAELMAPDLGWSAEEAERQADAYVALVEAERAAPSLPQTDLVS